jgi:sodium/bile acid cotransporter 7
MLRLLALNWFLLALGIAALGAFLAPEVARPLVSWLPPRVAVVAMLFTATLSLESRRLAAAIVRPWPAILAVGVSYGLMPLASHAIYHLHLPTGVCLGFCITLAVPCTMTAATIWTRLAGGNEAVALLVTLITTASSWLVTTGWLALLTGREIALDPLQMMLDLALSLILPVLAAQVVRLSAFVRALTEHRRTLLAILSQFVILTMVTQSLVRVAEHLRGSGGVNHASAVVGTLLACAVVHVLAAGTGWWLARAMHMARPDAIAVAIAGSQKTLPVGLLIIARFYADHPLAVVPLVFYHIVGLAIDTLLAGWFRRRERRQRATS